MPDPTLFAVAQSLPTDTFDTDQEPMTQLRFGIRQMFPKGDSLDIKRDMSVDKSSQQAKAQSDPQCRNNRKNRWDASIEHQRTCHASNPNH